MGEGADYLPPPTLSSVVVMLEPITAALTSGATSNGYGGGVIDPRSLLSLMDICTCACAERHSRVQCVTASMGDVVFEHYPRCGDMLELTARPVLVGRTSIDISLTVVSEGPAGGRPGTGGADAGGLVRRDVCEAHFTYVTTRGPDGEKRFVPALEGSSVNPLSVLSPSLAGQRVWEMSIARFRKSMIQSEISEMILPTDDFEGYETEASPSFDLEMTEVVLPAHQNHMGHTFGGVVMSWMAKAAVAAASRTARCSTGALRISAVLRVTFSAGSNVSDHLVFRPRVNAVFDGGSIAEVGVLVSKRSIASGEEVRLNTGYFYVMAAEEGTRPFPPGGGEPAPDSAPAQRQRHLQARRQFLMSVGDPLRWGPDLRHEAPTLTLFSTLRLLQNGDTSLRWHLVDWKGLVAKIFSQSSNRVEVEWASGAPRGRDHTFLLRAKETFRGNVGMSVPAVLDALLWRRTEWDRLCKDVTVLEAHSDDKREYYAKGANVVVNWDIIQHLARPPREVKLFAKKKKGGTSGSPSKAVPLCLLRAWREQREDGVSSAILAQRSVIHNKAAAEARTTVLPSGWFLRSLDGDDDGDADDDANAGGDNNFGTGATIEVSYIVEHDLRMLRKIIPLISDEIIVSLLASYLSKWMKALNNLDYTKYRPAIVKT